MIGELVFDLIFAGLGIIALAAVALGVIEVFGRFYATLKIFFRDDLIAEQRIIYTILVWFMPFGWLVYFLLGTDKTREAFSDLDVI